MNLRQNIVNSVGLFSKRREPHQLLCVPESYWNNSEGVVCKILRFSKFLKSNWRQDICLK